MAPRRKLSELSGLKWASGSAVEALLHRLDEQGSLAESFGGKSRRTLRRAVEADIGLVTEFGKVIQFLKLEAETGGYITVPFVHPFAYLNWLAHFSDEFANLLLQVHQTTPSSPSSPWRVVWYLDEFSPGNLLAVDNSRKAWGCYYSFLEFPQTLRQREIGWLLAGVVRAVHTHKIKGGVSAVFRGMMDQWFGESLNMQTTGFSVRVRGRSILVFAKLAATLADESALKHLWMCKGASGTKCCIKCLNLVSCRSTLAQHAPTELVDFACTDIAALVPNTDATIYAAIDELNRNRDLSKTKLEELETILGFSANRAGVLHDIRLRKFIHPAESTIYDWCHIFVANGICQWEMWKFVYELRNCGVKWSDIEEYHCHFNWPSHISDAPTQVWNEARESSSRSAGIIKMGASEFLSSYAIFRRFATEIFEGTANLEQECRSMNALLHAVDGLASHPKPSDADNLHRAIVAYIEAQKVAWPDNLKPKHHQALHVSSSVVQLGELLSCWVLERKHKSAKKYGTTSSQLGKWEVSVLTDLLNAQLEDFSKESDLASGVGIKGGVDATRELQHLFPAEASIIVARSAVCEGVRAARGDVAFVSSQAGVVEVARIRAFVQTPSSGKFYALVDPMRLVAGSSDVYSLVQTSCRVVYLQCILATAIWSDTMHDAGVVVIDPPIVAWGVALGRLAKR